MITAYIRHIMALLLVSTGIAFADSDPMPAELLGPTSTPYQIEVLAFKYKNNDALPAKFKPFAPLQRARNAIVLRPSFKDQTQPFQALPRQYFQLSKTEMRLQKDPRFEVLLHKAWRQTVKETRHPQFIHIFAGKAFDGYGRHMRRIENSSASAASYEWELDGRLAVHRRNRIEVDTHLWLRSPEDKSLLGFHHKGALVQYLLDAKRRIKLNELNYFDHPHFGLLVLVKPVKG